MDDFISNFRETTEVKVLMGAGWGGYGEGTGQQGL